MSTSPHKSRLERNAGYFKENIDGLELQVSLDRSQYAKHNNLFSFSNKSSLNYPDCRVCLRKYKPIGHHKDNKDKCPVCGFNFLIYKQCNNKLSKYYKESGDKIPKHLHKKVEFHEKCKFYPNENNMVSAFKQILKSKDCKDHLCDNMDNNKANCKECKNKPKCRKWKIMVFVLQYYKLYCDQQQHHNEDLYLDDNDEDDSKYDQDMDIQYNMSTLIESKTDSTDEDIDILPQNKLMNRAYSDPMSIPSQQRSISSVVETPQAPVWSPSNLMNDSQSSLNVLKMKPISSIDSNDDGPIPFSLSNFSRASSDPFMCKLPTETEYDEDGYIKEDDNDESNSDEYKDYEEDELDDEDCIIQQRATETFDHRISAISHSSQYNHVNKKCTTPHKIDLEMDGIIDIFSVFDCRWYTAKIVAFEQNRTCVTVQKVNVVSNNNKEEIINFNTEFWRIQLQQSRCNPNFIKSYDPNKVGIHSMYATKYGKQHQDISKAYYLKPQYDDLQQVSALIKGWMSLKIHSRSDNKQRYVSRFFVIRNDKKLRYYKSDMADIRQWCGEIDLKTIQELKKNPKEQTYSFIMKTAYQKQRYRVWYFKCKTSQILTDWMSVLYAFFLDKPPPIPYLHGNGSLGSVHALSSEANDINRKQQSWEIIVNSLNIIKTRSVEDDMQRYLNQMKVDVVFRGRMQTKGTGMFSRFKEQYFALCDTDKRLYHFQDFATKKLHELHYVDLRAIYKIERGLNQGEKKYCEFKLYEEGRVWEFRVKNENERMQWLESINRVWSGLKYTLTRLVNVLNKASDVPDFIASFFRRGYTLNNLLDDHIHVMRYHNKHDYRDIDNGGSSNIKGCDAETCKSWKRHQSDRIKDNFKSKMFCQRHFYTLNNDEIRLQDIFDNIHCFMYHRDDIGKNKGETNSNDDAKGSGIEPIKPRLERVKEGSIIEEEGKENGDAYYKASATSSVSVNSILANQTGRQLPNAWNCSYCICENRISSAYCQYCKHPRISRNATQKQSSLIPHNQTTKAGEYQNGDETHDHGIHQADSALLSDPDYDTSNYECDPDTFPDEQFTGSKMDYIKNSPKYSCFKDELLALGIMEDTWERELMKAKQKSQSKGATCKIATIVFA